MGDWLIEKSVIHSLTEGLKRPFVAHFVSSLQVYSDDKKRGRPGA